MKNSKQTSAGSAKKYHHGNLVSALVKATLEIIEERGVEGVSVREATRRAGVSPGAPFRHFRSKTALLTAVAEQAMSKLTESVAQALATSGQEDPLQAFIAIGHGYFQWALDNPTHFEIISSRKLIDFNSSETLCEQNGAIRSQMIDLLKAAESKGLLVDGLDFDHIVLGARALAYGLARMAIDGHFPEWHATETPKEAVTPTFDLFIKRIVK